MTGSCRLLAVFALLAAFTLLHAQEAAPDRFSGRQDGRVVPIPGPSLVPILGPKAGQNYLPPLMPSRIPPSPSPPLPFPIGHFPIAPGTVIFHELVRAAGIIFSGRVTSIGHAVSSSGQAPASTTITFAVERAMRGTSTGQNLTIHEWAGLWNGGEHYRVGERLLIFLYSPGKLGLTSPVAGAMGRFGMDSHGQVMMSQQHLATLAADPILGGRAVVPFTDFALAVRRSSREE